MGSKRGRRDFLKNGATLAGGLTLGAAVPALGQEPAAHDTVQMKAASRGTVVKLGYRGEPIVGPREDQMLVIRRRMRDTIGGKVREIHQHDRNIELRGGAGRPPRCLSVERGRGDVDAFASEHIGSNEGFTGCECDSASKQRWEYGGCRQENNEEERGSGNARPTPRQRAEIIHVCVNRWRQRAPVSIQPVRPSV